MANRVLRYCLYGMAGTGGLVNYKYYGEYESLAIVRLSRTAVTAFQIGYVYKTKLLKKKLDTNSEEYRNLKSECHQIGADKILELCKANKGAYIKVGQHIGALDYLLPTEYVQTMRVLHKDAPKNTVPELFSVIKEDLKVDPAHLFSEFDLEPLGTASLAQVHRARLKDGTEVAVKVQHSFVRKNIFIDLKTMELAIKIMSKVFPDLQLQWLVEETKKNIYKELNFLQEGANAEKVASLFKSYKWLKVPKINWKYSSERVLMMEYVNGGQVNDIKYIKEHKIDPYDLSRKLGDLYAHMIFVVGYVHSDPHPGNILVKKDPKDKETTVYLLDHGLYATLTDEFRYHYSKLWLSIIDRDREAMRIHSEHLGIRSELYGLFACIVTGRPWESIMKGIDKTKPSSEEKKIFQDNVPNFLNNITECLEKVDRQALLVFKTNDLIRSIEYALGTHTHMCGFMVMTQCCQESIYKSELRQTQSVFKKLKLRVQYTWSLLTIYLYGVYLNINSLFAAKYL